MVTAAGTTVTSGPRKDDFPPSEVLEAWGFSGARATAEPSGHINRTWRIEHSSGKFILQRLSPIFSPEVHEDIEAVTARLERVGLVTPRLVRGSEGSLWLEDGEGSIWRVLTLIAGRTVLAVESAAMCAEAGRLLGEFHRALWDFDYQPRHARLGVHDTRAHLAKLQRVTEEHSAHRAIARVKPLAEDILARAAGLDFDNELPGRLVHGDPKISNVIFNEKSEAVCLIDLDTIARMPLPVELGDALRSWCAPQGEEIEQDIDLDYFQAAVDGYAAAIGRLPGPAEREAIVDKLQTISLELATRFLADALEESYFGWDASRFESASEHNLVRARAQLALAKSVAGRRDDLRLIVRRAWG